MTCFLSLLAALVVLISAAHAPAQPDGQTAPDTERPRYRASLDGRGSLMLTDELTNRVLIAGSWLPGLLHNGVTPTVELVSKPDGLDLVYTYANTTSQPQPLGGIIFGGIRLPAHATQRTFYQDTSLRVLPGYGFYNHRVYPSDIYSPVQVLADDQHIIGFSLLYPVVEYDHRATIVLDGIDRAGAPGGPHWSHEFRFPGVFIPPNTTRTYTVAVRVASASDSFLTTLLPYREYFRQLYGPVQYQRDGRRVTGDTISLVSDISPTNPQGFRNPDYRPDTNGWRPWVDRVLAFAQRGYQRVVLWTPSGVMADDYYNFPSLFMTPLNGYPLARLTMPEFHRVSQAGMSLGFWWGNCSTLMRTWNPPSAEPLNPDDPEHVSLAFAELDMAVAAGARIIGMDAFNQASPAKQYRWLLMLKARAPHVTFVPETAVSDYIHNLAPTFHEANAIQTPHLLADFINPGHETWAAVHSSPESVAEDRLPTLAELQREVQRVESLGYVPLLYGGILAPPVGPVIADQPIETSVGTGQSARLSVTIGSSVGGVGYRWRKNGVDLTNGPTGGAGSISGADTNTLQINGVNSGDVAVYSVVVADDHGFSSSLAATLLIDDSPPCSADFNADGNVNPDDLADFITCFFMDIQAPGVCPAADINHDGFRIPDDLAEYITLFFFGC